jgi:hypothetical protein
MGSQVCVVTLPASQALKATPARLQVHSKGFRAEYKPNLAMNRLRYRISQVAQQPKVQPRERTTVCGTFRG